MTMNMKLIGALHLEMTRTGRKPYRLNEQERDIILAALRLWQRSMIHQDDELMEIACNGRDGVHAFLYDDEIDDLCERLNK